VLRTEDQSVHSSDARKTAYAKRLDDERRHYDRLTEFDDLPPMYHYWSHTFVRPMLEPLGCSHPREFLAQYLGKSARRCAARRPVFLSIGSGDGNNELEICRLLAQGGVADFTIDCLEMNPTLIERASRAAERAGLASRLRFEQADFNAWRPRRVYHGVMANQSLHHATNLEGLFDSVRRALVPGAYFVTSDIIGRNGHQRWPEARRLVDRFWDQLPPSYRFHQQLKRYEEFFEDWDCSSEGFEGIRSQEVLPLLLERFFFHVFVGFGNIIDPFVDRGFGPNFDPAKTWDRAFIDRVHACDERALVSGYLTPTHMAAVLAAEPCDAPYLSRGLTPEASVRRPDRALRSDEIERAEARLAPYFQVREAHLPLRGGVHQAGDARGCYDDGWAGSELEFTVVPDRDIRRFTVRAAFPNVVPAGAELRVEANGVLLASAAATKDVSIGCDLRLAKGEPVKLLVATNATVNPKALGLGDDERDLGFHVNAVIFEA
jgi:SAM-dependent methyltransferase